MADNKWAVMGGLALNVEYTRKYGFDASAAAKVTATLVAVPPPQPFSRRCRRAWPGSRRRSSAQSGEQVPRRRPTHGGS